MSHPSKRKNSGKKTMTPKIIQFAGPSLRLDFARGDIARVDIVGVDMMFTLKNGGQFVVQRLALEAVSNRPPSIQFADGASSAAAMINQAGKVEIGQETKLPRKETDQPDKETEQPGEKNKY